MKNILFALLFLASPACAASKIDLYDFRKGLMDMVSPERIPQEYTPNCLNVVLDKDMGIVKRNGYTKFNTTALTGSKSTRGAYTYKKNDGTHYLLVTSSNSIFSTSGNGTFTPIKQGLSATARQTFSTALDCVYGGDGTDNEWKWDGSTYTEFTVSNSTNMVKAKYHCWYRNRMFRAGVTGSLSTLYYSALGDPADLGNGTQWDFISQDDGDYITWVCPSADGSFLCIFKNYSTWGLYGTNPETWSIKCLSPDIGCLYGTTVDNINGNLVFVSNKRSIESFDGSVFTSISDNIKDQMDNMWQMNTGSKDIRVGSESDWGAGVSVAIDTYTYSGSIALKSSDVLFLDDTAAEFSGTGTNIDTTTYVGSVAMSSVGSYLQKSSSLSGYEYYIDSDGHNYFRQKIVTSDSDIVVSSIVVHVGGDGSYDRQSRTLYLYLKDKSLSVMASMTSTRTMWVEGPYDKPYLTLYASSTLTANSTYYIEVIGLQSDTEPGYWRTSIYTGESSSVINDYMEAHSGNGSVSYSATPYYMAMHIFSVPAKASYTSSVNTASNWTSWYKFHALVNTPTGSSISWYVKTSTASDNFSMLIASPIISGSYIVNSSGPYIQYIASFTRTSATAVPRIYGAQCSWRDYGLHTSPVMQATNWGSWGAFNANETGTTGSVTYFVKTSTASDNFASKTAISVSRGGTISSTDGPYIQVISSITPYFFPTSLGIASPRVDDYSITYYGSDFVFPIGISYKDSYWLAISTDTNTLINNVVYRYNQNGAWELYNGIYANSMAIYRGNLITGCSDDKGFLYTQDVNGLYTDDGNSYNSSYETRIMDCGEPFAEKDFQSIWASLKSNSGDLNISYRLDGSVGDYTQIPFSMDFGDMIGAQKINLPAFTKSRYIQLKVDSESYFNLRGMSLYYDVLPLQ